MAIQRFLTSVLASRFPSRRSCSALAAVAALVAGCGSSLDPAPSKSAAPQFAERIVSFPMPGTTAVLATTRRADVLVGAHAEAIVALGASSLREAYGDALRTSTAMVGAGFRPNVEELLRARPDLVMQWADRGAGLVEPIERAGLRVLPVRFGTEAEARAALTQLGLAVGAATRTRAMLAWRDRIERELDDVRRTLASPPPRVLYLARIASGYQAAGGDHYVEEALARAAGRNVATALRGTPLLGPEQILELSPDVIVLGSFESPAGLGRLLRDPRLAAIPAVRGGRVYHVPIGGYRWDPPSQESPLYWLWLAHKLHPGAAWPALEPAVIEAFDVLYGVRIDTDGARKILAGRTAS